MWLLHNYFLPTLNSSSVPPLHAGPLHPMEPILKRYKSLRKTVIRDVSQMKRHTPEITTILREVERWIAEAKAAANIATVNWNVAFADDADREDLDVKERWALDRLCDELLEKEVLVPRSKKCVLVTVLIIGDITSDFFVSLGSEYFRRTRSHHPPCLLRYGVIC